MKLGTLLGVTLLLSSLSLGGCTSEGAQTQEENGSLADSDLATSQRQAQLNGLRPRVTQDFKNVRAAKLVFKIERLKTEGDVAFIQATIMKRDEDGKDSELSDADLKGSVYAEEIREGLFDGPVVTALLRKTGNAWKVETNKGGQEAYVVGPTDVAWVTWDVDFNVPSTLVR